jgi:mRNA interferase MazF
VEKDFDTWSTHKKTLHQYGENRFYREGEVWWCALGVNIGTEQDGTGTNFDRPIVVVRAFNRSMFLGVALTGKVREGPFYMPLGLIGGREASAILSQVRLIDTRRLIRRIDTLDAPIFTQLRARLRDTLFP